MKKSDIDREIEEARKGITGEIDRWKAIRSGGCNDPAWTDGVNMNLARNHVIYYKHKLREICEANGRAIPDEYYLSTPPEVSNNFMANLKQKKRVESLKHGGRELCRKAPEYHPEQMSFL